MGYKVTAKKLIDFIDRCKSPFHVIENFREILVNEGYTEIFENKTWDITKGGKYFITRNESTIIAFSVPEEEMESYMISAAHSDSPTFKIKENPIKSVEGMTQLITEGYGGMLMAPWFDRPLSLAGRVLVEKEGVYKAKKINIDRDLMIIPSVAIHLNREANKGINYNLSVDTYPLLGATEVSQLNKILLGDEAEKTNVVGHDLYLYLREKGTLLGADEELISSPKIDDLECAWTTLMGFLNANKTKNSSKTLKIWAVMDNEEIGSDTKQGAGSSMLRDTMLRVVKALGKDEDEYIRMLSESMLVSADNAHAIHPNHPEYSDKNNAPKLNQGVVIKYNADQKYTTDGISSGIFKEILKKAGVPVQHYANRSDLGGGSTLGSIATTKTPMMAVDIGLGQLAMHSPFETAGAMDVEYMIKAMTEFFKSKIEINKDEYRLV